MLIFRRPGRLGLATMLAATALLCIGSAAAAKTVYVDGVNGNNAWDGLCEDWDGGTCGPKKTIQAGIDVAVDSDEVIVADATYTGVGNRDLYLNGKAIWLHSENGPDNCIIDGTNNAIPAFSFYAAGPATVIDGFMVAKFASC